uniref:Translation factor SUI1 homolog n=1 Tax=Caligus rogercresseyi TaxID=217165 RepID=C1BMV6_CALRO|nr:translation factor SUI1 homolog [Caligus rogercresseyi]
MSLDNLRDFDPFADAAKGDDESVQDGLVHIRIQQRSGRKTLTTIQGLSNEYDLKKIVRACKKEFACNGTVVDHQEYGKCLQLQGDQRQTSIKNIRKRSIPHSKKISSRRKIQDVLP